MSDTNHNVSSVKPPNPLLEPLFHALDPISLILNQNSHSSHQQHLFPLRLTTPESFIMERGPKYKAYAELRETRLRLRHHQQQQVEKPKVTTTPPTRKQVKFQCGLGSMRKGSSSILAQSVPDFIAALRKENRKPVNNNNNTTTLLPSLMEMTPSPMKSFSNNNNNNGVVLSGSRGSKSASAAGEKKKGGVLMARKSYASIGELKSLSSATAHAINGEGRGGGGGGRNGRVMGKSVSGYY